MATIKTSWEDSSFLLVFVPIPSRSTYIWQPAMIVSNYTKTDTCEATDFGRFLCRLPDLYIKNSCTAVIFILR